MMTPTELVRSRFPDAKPDGSGGWRARGRCHDGNSPNSLSIKQGASGGALVHCFNGCSTADICESIDLKVSDLMPPKSNGTSNGTGHHHSNGTGAPVKSKGKPFDSLEAAIEAAERSTGGTLAGQWEYVDADGVLVGVVARFNLPTEPGDKQRKTFRPFHPDGSGWRTGDPPGKWPVYGRIGPRTYHVEGEACCDLMNNLGLCCITSAHGADGVGLTDWSAVEGVEIITLPDNDTKGAKYAQAVAAILRGQGCKGRIVELPDLPPKGDIADLLGEDGDWSCKDDADIVEALEELAAGAPEWRPVSDTSTAGDDSGRTSRLRTRLMSEIHAMQTEWLWRNRFPLGALSLIFGNPDAGKTTLALAIAAHVSRGTPFPDGSPCPHGRVLILSAEDDPARTLRQRLEAAGADLDRIIIIEAVRDATTPDGEPNERPFDMQRDLPELARLMDELGDVRLIIIDPLNGYLGDNVNSWRDSDVRRVLHPLVALALRTGVAVLGLAHPNKGKSDGPAQYSVGGSIAFPAVARAVWQVVRDEHDERRRLMLRAKCNLAPDDVGGLGFAMISSPVNNAAAIQWEREAVRQSADEWRAENRKTDREPSGVERCCVWLAERLEHGPADAKWLYEEADGGQGFKRHTVDGAATRLKVDRRKVGGVGEPGKWVWSLPERGAK